ncbi:MAG TPA: hypothetical protein VM577_19090 [Anaerovoracaceae bacterium]|nr:hypothetical protein [Anaerovoracaceae bacterium]
MISLTPQELKIVSFLQTKKSVKVDDLFQFAKPGVKIKTLQKIISDLKRKYKLADIAFPKCEIKFKAQTKIEPKEIKVEQKLIQVVKKKPEPIPELPRFQLDFKLNYNRRQVITREGTFTIDNIDDWEMLKFFWKNPDRRIPIEELKDLYWHNWGSKTPSRWMDSITRRVTKLRRAVPPLIGRLITVPDPKQGTFYLVMSEPKPN